MRRVLRWFGWGLGAVSSIALVAGVVLYVLGGRRLNRPYEVQPPALVLAGDSVAIERGRHLASSITGCIACHRDNLGGRVLEDVGGIFTLGAPNLTRGSGGIGSRYTDADFVRAIRHGVNQQGRGLLVMHSDVYNNLSREDLGAIVAYVKAAAPVDGEVMTRVRPLGRIMLAMGLLDSPAIPLIPAEVIDHGSAIPESPTRDTSAAYGRYLMSITLCHMCHGADMRGAPPIDPTYPAGPNVAARAESGLWSREQFMTVMRTGVTPDGRQLNNEYMPWEYFSGMTDEELIALWMHIGELARTG